MPAKSILIILCTVFISILLLSACITYKYSKIDVPDIRKVDKYDGDALIGTFYQKYDRETLGWYEAEKNNENKWRFTSKGEMERKWKIDEGLRGEQQLFLRRRNW